MNLDGFRSNCSDWHVGCWGQWCGSGHYFGGSSVCRILSFFWCFCLPTKPLTRGQTDTVPFFLRDFFFSIGQGRESWGSKKPYCKRFPFLCFLSWPLRWALGPSWIFKAFILEFGVQVLAYRRRCAWTKMPIRDGLVGWVVEKMETCDMTLE